LDESTYGATNKEGDAGETRSHRHRPDEVGSTAVAAQERAAVVVADATVRVRRSTRRSESGTVRTDLPKTPASIRTVSLAAPLADVLAAHLAEFVSEAPDAPLFRTAAGTLPARSNLSLTFGRALVAAGAPQVRFHDLRHVAQVYAAEAGATLPELMARLGHATPPPRWSSCTPDQIAIRRLWMRSVARWSRPGDRIASGAEADHGLDLK
jgi:hypothetical protein